MFEPLSIPPEIQAFLDTREEITKAYRKREFGMMLDTSLLWQPPPVAPGFAELGKPKPADTFTQEQVWMRWVRYPSWPYGGL